MKSITPAAPLKLTVDTRDLTPTQVRIIKQAHTMLLQALTAEDEAEYFEAAAQLLKQSMQAIKHANFPVTQRDGIPYDEQAIEYALDGLNEALNTNGHINLDN